MYWNLIFQVPLQVSLSTYFSIRHNYPFLHSLHSGNPATDVAIDRIPASTDADATIFQSTAPMTDAVPIVAIKVCATVLTALTPAFLHHSFVLTLGFNTQFLNILFTFFNLSYKIFSSYLLKYANFHCVDKKSHQCCGKCADQRIDGFCLFFQ